MTRVRRILAEWALVLCVCVGATRDAQSGEPSDPRPETVATADGIVVEAPAGSILAGRWFDLAVHGPFGAEARLEFPADQELLLDGGPEERSVETDRVVLVRRTVALRAGELAVEGLHVTWGDTRVPVPGFVLHVDSGLDPDVQPRVSAPLDPLDLPLPAESGAPFVLAHVLALALLGAWIVRTTRAVVVPVHRPPPDLVAIAALANLRLRLPRGTDDIAPFVVDVSAVLRAYVEGRFELHAPARTTEEFLAEVALRDDAVAARAATLGAFLTACDLVKFARARPGRDELLALVSTAETFVEETRSRANEADDASPASAGDDRLRDASRAEGEPA